jgi:hypothetical protein
MKSRTWAVALAAAIGAAVPAAARAQENPSPDQMKKMYDEVVVQLKAAQERKNHLAAENEKLGQQVEAMRKDAAATAARLDELRRSDAEHAEKSFFLRAHYVAWQQFVRQSPETEARWRAFLGDDYLAAAGRVAAEVPDRAWPIPAERPNPTSQPATAPTASTLPATPATQPATTLSATTQPVVTQPAATQPASAPAATQPAGTAPTTGPSSHPS